MADGGIVLDASLLNSRCRSVPRAIDKMAKCACRWRAFEGVVAVSPSPHDEIVNAAQPTIATSS